jgi:GntR family transcriptional regulator
MDPTSGMPAFRQVAAELRGKIAAGEFGHGGRLPSERELVETYRVSRPTIREAVNLLRAEGLVVVEHGRGVFVRSAVDVHRRDAVSRLSRTARAAGQGAFLADAAAEGFTPSTSVEVRFEQADDRVAGILRVSPGEEVTVRDRILYADGIAVQLSVSRLSRYATRGTAIEEPDAGPGGTYARLEDAGDRIGRFTETVGARMPTPAEASRLRITPGVPVLTVTRVAHRQDGFPLEMNDIVLPADRYETTYTWDTSK